VQVTGNVALPPNGPRRRLSARLTRSPRGRLALLLAAPLLWLGLAYLGALAALLVTALWTTNTFTGDIERVWTLDNLRIVVTDSVYRSVTLRTVGVAALVTVIDAVLAAPVAFFMAKVASPRWQPLLVAGILLPLWASYLVKAYAWRSMFGGGGLIDWAGSPFHLGSPGYGLTATVCTLAYL